MPSGIYLRTKKHGRKISKALKGKPKPWQKGKSFFEGKIHTEKTKEKISESRKGKCLGNTNGFKKGNIPWNKIGDGITPLYIRIKTSAEYKKWRGEIFKRDDYTCQICGSRNGNGKKIVLNIDHYPTTFSQIVKENNIKSIDDAIFCSRLWNLVENRTLCEDCHKETPTYRKG